VFRQRLCSCDQKRRTKTQVHANEDTMIHEIYCQHVFGPTGRASLDNRLRATRRIVHRVACTNCNWANNMKLTPVNAPW
jgi:hypothetical protein